MFTTARRHAQTSHQQSSTASPKLKSSPKPAHSAPPTPVAAHTAAVGVQRPQTANAAITPASFSRATAKTLVGGNGDLRPATAGVGLVHLPPSVPLSFPTPSSSPRLSPLRLTMPNNGSSGLGLRGLCPSPSMTATPSLSPLSSGLPSPTLPPLPSAHLPRLPPSYPNNLSKPIDISSSNLRSPMISINVAPSTNSCISASDSHSLSSPISSPNSPLSPDSPASRRSSQHHEDVLSPGDRVGEGLSLLGETIRVVDTSMSWEQEVDTAFGNFDKNKYGKEEPAPEFEVVRRLGAGSYAVVYLVREVLDHPPAGILDGLYESTCPVSSGEIDNDNSSFNWDSEEELGGALYDDDLRARRKGDKNSNQGKKVYYGKEYAVKVLSKAGMNNEELEAQLVEANIHQSLPSHPNIVTLHRTLETSSFLLLVLEFVPGEDLYYFLEQARDHYEPVKSGDTTVYGDANASVLSVNTVNTMNTTRTPPTPSLLSTLDEKQLLSRRRLKLIASMFSQMCEAVAVCHDEGVYHRDIKPENFIVTDGWDEDERRQVVVKLTDFGLSTRETASSDMDCGSAPYMSYECRNNCAPTYAPRAADVWSLGIVLINMLYHVNPWTDTTQGVCPSFSAFLAAPELFFMQRFSGMEASVAQFLARRVFCVLPSDDSNDNAGRRVSAREFGNWVKDLHRVLSREEPVGIPPALESLDKMVEDNEEEEEEVEINTEPSSMPFPTSSPTQSAPSSSLLAQSLAQIFAQQEAATDAGPSSPAWRHRRGLSNASIGYALSSVPQSRRPSSRKPSFSFGGSGLNIGLGSVSGSRTATPMVRTRNLSSSVASAGGAARGLATGNCEPVVTELATVLDEGEGDLSIVSMNGEKEGVALGLHLEQGHERDIAEQEEHGQGNEGECETETGSRSQSVVRRRKRGARRGKGQIIQQQQQEIARLQKEQEELAKKVRELELQQHQTTIQVQNQVTSSYSVSSPTEPGTLDRVDTLARESEALARELSRTKNTRSSSTLASSGAHSQTSQQSQTSSMSPMRAFLSGSSSKSKSRTRDASPASSSSNLKTTNADGSNPEAAVLAAAGGPTPGAMFPVSFAMSSVTSSSKGSRRSTAPAVSSSLSISMTEASEMETNVANDIATTPTQTSPNTPIISAPAPAPVTIVKKTSKWKLSFGKSSNSNSSHIRAPVPTPQTSTHTEPQVIDLTGDADRYNHSVRSNNGGRYSPPSMYNPVLGHAQSGSAANTEQWSRGRRPANGNSASSTWGSSGYSTRNVSPTSTRNGRFNVSSAASSVSHSSASNNWRNSTLTASSGSSLNSSSAASGFTRYSNGSVRSVSTVATSVSGGSAGESWRNNGLGSSASLASGDKKLGHGHGTPSISSRNSDRSSFAGMPPPNVKIMEGVPWALDELPRQLQPNSSADMYGMRKQRARKPKDLPTINERPIRQKSPLSQSQLQVHSNSIGQRTDEGRSSNELQYEEEEERADGTPRKVQKGQINALAKMLSALRR